MRTARRGTGFWVAAAIAFSSAGPLGAAVAIQRPPDGKAAPGGAPAVADRIYWARQPEKPDAVEVVEETATHVVFKRGGQVLREFHSLVLRVDYGDTPPAFREGMRSLSDGKPEEALAKFQAAAGSKRTRKAWLEPYTAFYAARCQHLLSRSAKAGAAAEATQGYRAYLDKFQNHKFRDEAIVRLAELHLEEHDAKSAQGILQKYQSTLHGKWIPEGRFLAARIAKEAENNLIRAQAQFDALSHDRDNPELAARARFEAGICMILNKKAEDAKAHFEKWIAETPKGQDPPPISKNGLGEALFALGQPKAALIQFVEVAVTGFADRSEQARALFRAGECWEKLEKRDEAKKRFGHCAENFADTEWGLRSKTK